MCVWLFHFGGGGLGISSVSQKIDVLVLSQLASIGFPLKLLLLVGVFLDYSEKYSIKSLSTEPCCNKARMLKFCVDSIFSVKYSYASYCII